jgi:hypothetical protein
MVSSLPSTHGDDMHTDAEGKNGIERGARSGTEPI